MCLRLIAETDARSVGDSQPSYLKCECSGSTNVLNFKLCMRRTCVETSVHVAHLILFCNFLYISQNTHKQNLFLHLNSLALPTYNPAAVLRITVRLLRENTFLAVFVYAAHATQAIAFEWKPGFSLCKFSSVY